MAIFKPVYLLAVIAENLIFKVMKRKGNHSKYGYHFIFQVNECSVLSKENK
jgi:hypothetical protein